MAEPLPIDAHSPTPVACEHVLHVVDADIAARFGPMIGQAAQGVAAAGIGTAVLTDDPVWAARFATTPVERHVVPRWGGWHGWGLAGWLDAHLSRARRSYTSGAPPVSGGWRRRARSSGVPLVSHALGLRQVEHLRWAGLSPASR